MPDDQNKRYDHGWYRGDVLKEELGGLCQKTLDICRELKADQAEVYGEKSDGVRIRVYKSEVESLTSQSSYGIAVRVFIGGALGFAFTTGLDDLSLRNCVEKAAQNARSTNSDDNNGLPEPSSYGQLDIYRSALVDMPIKDKVKLTIDMERAAYAYDKRISEIDTALYSDGASEIFLVNSLGFTGNYRFTECYIYLSCIAREDGNVSTSYSYGIGREPGYFDVDKLVAKAASRAVSLLGAKPIKSKKLPVVLDPEVFSQILGAIAYNVSADSVLKGRSLFINRIGERIGSASVRLSDDATIPNGFGSRPFDGEGVGKEATTVIESGILKTYLYNTYTAKRMNTVSTGNAARHSFKSIPEVGISNFIFEKGMFDQATLFSKARNGIYITEVMGFHSGVNPITGEFSVGAKGFLIEDGEISRPVKEITVSSDLISILKGIVEGGSDFELFPSAGSIGCPSVLLEELTVAGSG
ncbi:MAG: TldD/PmbA family protein [Actinobacteria bacterium]|nr:TldD/PmbA family protein [Actinomycetota bacterium]